MFSLDPVSYTHLDVYKRQIKGLLWEGTGFLLLYKRLEDGSFSWPRTPEEAAELTRDQYQMLMQGLNPIVPKIKEVHPKHVL